MHRHIVRVVASCALFVVVAGCSGSIDPATADPEDIDTCEDLATAIVLLVTDYVELVSQQPIDELLDASNPPDVLARLDTRAAALGARVQAVGCSSAQIDSLTAPGLNEIRADGVVGERFLQLILETAGVG